MNDIELEFHNEFTEETLKRRRSKLDNNPSSDMVWFVAKVRNKVIGVCEIAKRGEKNELQALYVLLKYQKVGNEPLLWGEAKKHLDKDKKTIVKVHIHNTEAQSL